MPAIFDHLIDWSQLGPWLALLWLLVIGLGLPLGIIEALDRWADTGFQIDRIALATRYGGYMNSWAVFGRGASDYRDLRPLFPDAAAAELARFPDRTACLAVRFASPAAAKEAATGHFGSFAAAGVEFDGTGLSFHTENYGRCGRWLVVEDTLFAFYGPTSAALAARQRQTPCLIVRSFPAVLRALRDRWGFTAATLVWLCLNISVGTVMLERAFARHPVPGISVATEADLLAGLAGSDWRLRREGDLFLVEPVADDPRRRDFAILNERNGLYGVVLQLHLVPEKHRVEVLVLQGKIPDSDTVRQRAAWVNLGGLGLPANSVISNVRDAVLTAGWSWQPRLWPFRF